MLLTPEILAILMIVGIQRDAIGSQSYKWSSLDGNARIFYYAPGADNRADEYVSCYSQLEGASFEITDPAVLLDFLRTYF